MRLSGGGRGGEGVTTAEMGEGEERAVGGGGGGHDPVRHGEGGEGAVGGSCASIGMGVKVLVREVLLSHPLDLPTPTNSTPHTCAPAPPHPLLHLRSPSCMHTHNTHSHAQPAI